MKKNIIILISFLVAIIVFFFLGYWLGSTKISNNINSGNQREEIIAEMQDRLLRAGHIPLPPKIIYSLTDAKIKSVGSVNAPYIIVEPSIIQDPFENLFAKEIKVVFMDNTNIEKVIREVDTETGAENYISSKLMLNNLVLGEVVDISSGDNIIGKAEITAETITKKEF